MRPEYITANINAMEAQGAPPEDIQAYLNSLGAMPNSGRTMAQPQPQQAPSNFNFQAAGDVFTRTADDINLAREAGNPFKTGLTMFRGALAPFQALGAGFAESRQGQFIVGNTIDKMTQFGEAITPQAIQNYIKDQADQVIFGYENMTPQQQLDQRNKLALAEVLSYFVGIGAAKTVIPDSLPFKETVNKVTNVAGDLMDNPIRSMDLGKVPKTPNKALDVLEESYYKSMVENRADVNNALAKQADARSTSDQKITPNLLIRELAANGVFPQVKGKLADFSEAVGRLDDEKSRIGQEINQLLANRTEVTSLSSLKKETVAILANSKQIDVTLDTALDQVERFFRGLDVKTRKAEGYSPGKLNPTQLNRVRVNMNAQTRAFRQADFHQDVADAVADAVRKRLDTIEPQVREKNKDWARLQRVKKTATVLQMKPINVGYFNSSMGRLIAATSLGSAGVATGSGSLIIAGIAAHFGGEAMARLLRSKALSPKSQKVILDAIKANPEFAKKILDDVRGKDKAMLAKQIIDPDAPIEFEKIPDVNLRGDKSGQLQTESKSPNEINSSDPSTIDMRKSQGVSKQVTAPKQPLRKAPTRGTTRATTQAPKGWFAGVERGSLNFFGKKEPELDRIRREQAERLSESSTQGITNNLGKKIDPSKIDGPDPILNLKRELVVKDLQGKSHTLLTGEAIQPTRLKNGNVHIIDGEEFVINKNQYQNLKGMSLVETEPEPFAPELSDTTETILGAEAKGGRPKTKGSGQDYKSWSESEKNKRGKNYSMIVVQAPIDSISPDSPKTFKVRERIATADDESSDIDIGDTIYDVWRESDDYAIYTTANREEATEYLKKQQKEGPYQLSRPAFTGGHATAPNQLFHIRVYEDMYKGEPVLFVDEFQSDWMLALRKEAERIAQKQLPGATEVEVSQRANNLLRAYKNGQQPEKNTELPYGVKTQKQSDGTYSVEHQGRNIFPGETFSSKDGAVVEALKYFNKGTQFETPWNPLLDNWVPMAAKRALEEAQARGATRVVWTNGAQQRARYSSISQEVERMTWKKNDTGKEVSIKVKNRNSIDLTIDGDGKVVTASSHENELKGKYLNDVILSKNAKQIMNEDSGDLTGADMAFGGTWTEALYERQMVKTMEEITGQKAELVDMGYSLKKVDTEGGTLTDEQIEELQERGIDPDLDPQDVSEGNLVSYFGEDYRVYLEDGGGGWAIPERYIAGNYDYTDYRRDEYDFVYENFTYKADQEIPYYTDHWNELAERKFHDGGITYSVNGRTDYLLKTPGDWGSDKNAPVLIEANQIPDDVETYGFSYEDVVAYLQDKLEDSPVQSDLFGEEKTKFDLIQGFLDNEVLTTDADHNFIHQAIKDGDIEIDDLIEQVLDDRGMDSAEGVAANMNESYGGNRYLAVGDEVWRLDEDAGSIEDVRTYIATDEDVLEQMRSENAGIDLGNAKETGLLQPAIPLTDAVKAKILGEKGILGLPSGRRGEMLPVFFPLLLGLMATQGE